MKFKILLSAILITSFVCSIVGQGGNCGRYVYRYVSDEEWLGVDDLGMDLDMSSLNDNWADDATNADIGASEASDNETATNGESTEVVPLIDLTGKWSLEMDIDASVKDGSFVIGGGNGLNDADGADKYVDLNIYQNGDVIFGWGFMNSEDEEIPVDVSGSIVEEQIDLNLMPVLGSDLYVMTLLFSEESLSGRYYGYNIAGEFWSGTVGGRPSQ